MKPNFLLIGAPKAATTSLCVMLERHPEIYMVEGKEPHFFSYDQIYARGWDWYESRFAGYRNQKSIGDGSTSYSMTGAFPNVIPRIVKHLPDARIIYAVRHPLDRMESAYVERMTTPGNPKVFATINEAVRHERNLIDSSRYWKQISAYRKHFPDPRIWIVWFEEYVNDPDAVLAGLFEFLEVDPTVKIPHSDAAIGSRESRIARMQVQGRARPLVTTWKRRTRQWVIDQLGDDPARFLKWCGKPQDYWRLEAGDKTGARD